MSANNPKEQFGQIYDQYVEKIYRFVYLKVNSQEIAEDIASKVFLKGWQVYRDDQKSIKSIGAFLYAIARNLVTDHYREKDRTRTVSQDKVPQVVDHRTNLYEKAVLSADVEVVRIAMQHIKKDYQDVLIWHYLDDMPATEIAQLLNKPVGTVRVMIHRGLESLKDELIKEA